MKKLLGYWQTKFDWRAQERSINRFHNYRTTIDGVGIHFIHEKGRGPKPLPLLLMHGWPSSFAEFLKVIPLMTDPAANGGDPRDSFDVVVPSLPGYGFSDPFRMKVNGLYYSMRRAELLLRLMTEVLGYDRFGAQGADEGRFLAALLARDHPHQMIGIHLSDSPWVGKEARGGRELSEAEKAYLKEGERAYRQQAGYAHIQGTRP
jgi:pimeloyl-ACP methyl ester carboxylesterase